ncbi:MAG: histidine phosphatase family protein [Phycisphaerae bacterium]|nr:histidine phosphatase family protein [Phycisphaerae bacterium]
MNPSDTAHFAVIRHGETVWNTTGLQQGQLDGELNELGVRQAQAVGRALSNDRFDALYSSDLNRAVQTAEIIATMIGLEVVTDARLRERHLGCIQGVTLAELQREHPDLYARFRSDDADHAPPGGESSRRVYERCVTCTAELADRHAGQSVVIVTHGGILDRLLRRTLDLPIKGPRNHSLYNASINRFAIGHGKWRLEQWGLTEHLRELGTIDDW